MSLSRKNFFFWNNAEQKLRLMMHLKSHYQD